MHRKVVGPRVAAFAVTQPGMGRLVRREAEVRGVDVGRIGSDGRGDVVSLAAGSWDDLSDLRTAEVVCADAGRLRLLPSAGATARQLDWDRLAAALARQRGEGLLVAGSAVRVVVRLQHEKGFSRTQLRVALTRRLRAPVVRGHEQANEIWCVEDARRAIRVGIRVPRVEATRPRRWVERPGALRPSVAAGLVLLAGVGRGRLLDPCCGSGSILAAATRAGWESVGGDVDEAALSAALRNSGAPVVRADARRLPFRADELAAVATNLPFGQRYSVQGAPVAWYRRTLTEALRVAPRAVVLAPPARPFREALGRLKVSLADRYDIEVLGRPTTIWVLDRRRG